MAGKGPGGRLLPVLACQIEWGPASPLVCHMLWRLPALGASSTIQITAAPVRPRWEPLSARFLELAEHSPPCVLSQARRAVLSRPRSATLRQPLVSWALRAHCRANS